MPLPSKPLPPIALADLARFWAKVSIPDEPIANDGCWEWAAGKFRTGYGKFRLGRRSVTAHRFVWVSLHGEPEQGLVVDHICENRACVRPDHLRLLTNSQNIRRTTDRITHCPQGHEYTPENTRLSSKGGRLCVVCTREAYRRYDAKRRPTKE